MSNNHNFLALDWVKSEIEETLKQAQQALRRIFPTLDESQLRFASPICTRFSVRCRWSNFMAPPCWLRKWKSSAFPWSMKVDSPARPTMYWSRPCFICRFTSNACKRQSGCPFVLLPIINTLRIAHDEIPLSEVSLFQPDFSRVYSIIGQEGETPSVEALKKLRLLLPVRAGCRYA